MPKTTSQTSRINARLDAEYTAKVEFLKRATGMPVSTLVKTSIDLLYRDVRTRKGAALERLTSSGFVASGEGPRDLSERYKEEVHEILARKHADR